MMVRMSYSVHKIGSCRQDTRKTECTEVVNKPNEFKLTKLVCYQKGKGSVLRKKKIIISFDLFKKQDYFGFIFFKGLDQSIILKISMFSAKSILSIFIQFLDGT